MRINKKIYPLLNKIYYEEMGGMIKPMYVSRTFFDDAIANRKKFTTGNTVNDLLDDEYSNEIFAEPFLLLMGSGVIFFGIYGKTLIAVHGEKTILESYVNYTTESGVSLSYWADDNIKSRGVNDTAFWGTIKALLLFKKFADVEEKQLPPNGKLKEFNCRYKSDFDFKIGLLTENWYRASCQNHPFMVRGHWRWQAHGTGMKERKLIWLDPYTKDGYTKGAYKQNL